MYVGSSWLHKASKGQGLLAERSHSVTGCAFGQELANAQRYARSTALSILRNYADDVPDVLQNAAIKALRFRHTFKGRSQFRVWFTRIVINESLMFLRTRNKEFVDIDEQNEDGSLAWDLPSFGPSPEVLAIGEELHRAVSYETSKLSPILRREVSRLLSEEGNGVNNTLKARRFRARRILRNRLLKNCFPVAKI